MGHHNHHFAGDTYAQTGVWGSPTSKANFCEEDYAITRFIAEFINSLSNLTYVYFALKYPGHSGSHSGKGTWAPGRLDSLSIALLLVGVTSTAFHATLLQAPQLTDDLSMLLLAGTLLQKVYCHGRPRHIALLVSASIWLPTSIAALIYVRSGNILIHVYIFAALVALIGSRLLYLIYCQRRSEQETTMLGLRFWKGVAFLALAYTVWNIDLEICSQLRTVRQRVGLPWAWLLELHGWWHVLTAAGAAWFIELVRILCEQEEGRMKGQGGGVRLAQRKPYAFPVPSSWHGLTAKSKADLDRIGAFR
ncbi:alkaline ceramidase family protein [Seiridium cupressi]|uniref:Ceramidase-domain-containing protein n=1 Tax=Seiridium unicorne TaxID=138068 RepID=A0ABR2UVR5_9PEZI